MSRSPCPRPIDPAWSRARLAQLRRDVMKKMRKFRNSEELRRLEAKAAARAEGP